MLRKLKDIVLEFGKTANRIVVKYLPPAAVFFLLIVSIVLLFLTTEDRINLSSGSHIISVINRYKIKSTILSNISTSFIISTIFWLVVVVLPTSLRKNALKKNMRMKYHYFRENIAKILYDSARSFMEDQGKTITEIPDSAELADRDKFRKFFGSDHLKMYYAAINGIQYDETIETEIKFELNKFSNEVSFFLNNIETRDQHVLDVFYRIQSHIANLMHSNIYKGDPAKYIGNYLYDLMASRSLVSGDLKYDLYEKVIKKA